MIFSKRYDMAIRKAVESKGFEIYRANNPNFKVPGQLSKFLVAPQKELELNMHYEVLPSRDLFSATDSAVLDSRVLELSKKAKPRIDLYGMEVELEGFTLKDNSVLLDVIKRPKKGGRGVTTNLNGNPLAEVSYMHFVGMVGKVSKLTTGY